MSEEQLTVEKINGASRTVDYRKHIAYTIDGKDVASCSIINFLLTHAAHLDSVLGASFNANDEIGMENIKLREQLATIERDTAEKCAEMARTHVLGTDEDGEDAFAYDVCEAILSHFNLGEKL